MTHDTDTIIVGAGQAGLAMSHSLARRGVPHVVLERGRIAERWRSERWDSFTLLSPNYQTRLPGHRYDGVEPDGFMSGDEVVTMLARYGRHAPVRTGVTVRSVEPTPTGWRVATTAGQYHGRDVVIATGDLDRPSVPAVAAELPTDVLQLHTSQYKRPSQLPAGATLVVGAGPSGQQIADELARSGRRVHIAVGRHKALPRRYRGRDSYWWMDRMGLLTRTVDSLPTHSAHRRSPNAVLTGGTRDLDLHRLVGNGVTPHGRLTAVTGSTACFADDLSAIVSAADDNAEQFRRVVDDYVLRAEINAPTERPTRPSAAWADRPARTLDLDACDVTSVIWATGFRRDFSWVDAAVFDAAGEPVQRRGVTSAAGLYFLGLRWMYRRSSSFLDGVGTDAEYLAGHIARCSPVLAESAA